jgi:hypothetical protein
MCLRRGSEAVHSCIRARALARERGMGTREKGNGKREKGKGKRETSEKGNRKREKTKRGRAGAVRVDGDCR